MKLYSVSAVETLISEYYAKGGECIEVEPGTLGFGLTICFGDGLKTAVVQEKYINPWNSAHTIRFYNEMPEKYGSMIENYFENIA